MSVVVSSSLVETVRFRVKDKSENTFIKYVFAEGINTHSTTKLVKFSQLTTLFWGLCSDKIQEFASHNLVGGEFLKVYLFIIYT